MKLLIEEAPELEANEALLEFAGVNVLQAEPKQAAPAGFDGRSSDAVFGELERLGMNLDFISASVTIPVVEGRPLPGYARLDYPDPLGSGVLRKVPIVDGLLPPGVSSAELMGKIVNPVVRMLSVRSLPAGATSISIQGVPGNCAEERTPFAARTKGPDVSDTLVLSEKQAQPKKTLAPKVPGF